MVVGGGVSGIQASLDLAGCGYKVYLIDEAPSIGGRMAQLDKTFPTNDCSMCILSPKLVECYRHPDIEIITNSSVKTVEGEAGNFTVHVVRKPKYVDEAKCVGCGTCARYCPVFIPDPFNENISSTKCIRVPFAQAVPLVSTVDPDSCLFLTRQECKICYPVCKNRAIDFTHKEEELELRVGAVVLSPGYRPFDPSSKAEYGYGRITNVVTSLEFERFSTASGPYRGEVVRPSDGQMPRRIAWVQCVGSRDVVSGNHYCSAVCCTYAAKQVINTKEHHSDIKAAVFFNDVRAFGKGFEQYYQRAKHLPDVRFIWSAVLVVDEIPENGNVVLRYCQDGSSVVEEEFDLVVLSVGLVPSTGVRELAAAASVELNDYRFCDGTAFTPGETSRPGVYASGTFIQPMDIPESVATGSAAASLCSQLLSQERGMLVSEKESVPERNTSGENPKVGVFVCRCGTNIGSVVNVPEIVDYSRNLDDVTYVEEQLYSCASDAVKRLSEVIAEKDLNRVIVAACTPRTHEPLFRETLKQAGLNPYLFEMANIREHCSWVHSWDRDAATEKAKDLVRMAAAKARLLQPRESVLIPVNQSALVVGGGIAGMTSALSLAEQGYGVHLVEKSNTLGGVANRIHETIGGDDVRELIRKLLVRVQNHSKIALYTQAEVEKVSGFVGNFSTRISLNLIGKTREILHGVAIIAIGGEEVKHSEYLYGEDSRVMTLIELEDELAKGEKGSELNSVVLVGCVGSREQYRPYCSRVCCGDMVKTAIKLKKDNTSTDVYVLYRDIRTYAFDEMHYRAAAELGVRFVRFDLDEKPVVEAVEGELRITVTDKVLDKRIAISADIVGLATGVASSRDSGKVSQLFKVPLNEDGFFVEAHLKLRPVDFAADGVFLCGLAHSPKSIDESISQAQAAAARAATVLSHEYIEASGIVGQVDADRCIGCGICESLCPFEAVELTCIQGKTRASITPASCKACGICAARCPTRAIVIHGFSDEQVMGQVAALAESWS
ncbi:FAD-dependent oxidoreductase [Chloroflexota bacterium]